MSDDKSMVLFGDSLLAEIRKSLILKLESKFKNTVVFNCATGGINTNDGIKRINLISKMKPNYVVLSFGANDCAPWKEQVPLELFTKNYTKIIKSFPLSEVIVFLCPMANFPDDNASSQLFNKQLLLYNSVSKQIALENKAKLIDIQLDLEKLFEAGQKYHEADGLHLNEIGYQVFIDELVRMVN